MSEPADRPTPAIPPRPCPAALGLVGVPARRWATRADLFAQLSEAKAFLDRCPLDEGSLAEAARSAGLSADHFLRLFREFFGITPHRYLTARRVESAKRLLSETDLSVSEIALESGFSGPTSFGRLFRAVVGCSPSAYRRAKK
ncbi:MAG: helix-turn-helix transcriptional regulator [Fimbriimonas ginsengisoli]|uniref:Helix-turn-helix transcriptional regulator n=1 Tax=Fimbriimonas ginsengisoli TaxID=1005039 RepID=A0A931PUF5_FIMGI|nr:helix-turn-helix transcriptional regulator [Fimbriimonas ginsengisoli]MBI3722261.1 helix-turn-helix transcriptional regulator [Fimbriimonas ginsengisoli]